MQDVKKAHEDANWREGQRLERTGEKQHNMTPTRNHDSPEPEIKEAPQARMQAAITNALRFKAND